MVFAACNDNGKWNGISFNHQDSKLKVKSTDVKEVDDSDIFTEDEMVFDVSVDMDFMVPKEDGDTLACAAINEYIITELLGQPKGTSQKDAVDGYISKAKSEFKTDEYMVTYYDHVKGVAEYGVEGVINYTMTEDFFGGGAHPTQNVVIKRFRSSDGTEIGLWDVFADSCSNALKHALVEKLMKQQNVSTMDELQEMGYLEMMDMFIPQNFSMGKDSISFFFNQYDIAPYACGQTTLSFGYDEIKKFMR